MSDLFYRLCQGCVRVLALLFVSLRVSGRENLPRKGPFILASNHVSHFDPPVLTAATGRPIDFLSSAEFFSHPFVAWFFTANNAFPFDRNRRDTASIKVCLERLRNGRCVGIFIEGGIRHGSASVLNGGPIKEGSLTLARNAQVPIVPTLLIGPDQLYQWRSLFRRPRLFVRYGRPILPTSEEDPRTLAQLFKQEIVRQLDELQKQTPLHEWEKPISAQERWKNH